MQNEKGYSLIEVLASLALVAVIGVAFITGLGTVSRVTLSEDEHGKAQNLAETQMEFIAGAAFASSYSAAPIPSEYGGYAADIEVEPVHDGNLQKITVIISHQGKQVTGLEAYKVR